MASLLRQKKIRGALIILCVAVVLGLVFFVAGEKRKSVSWRSAKSGWSIQNSELFVITKNFNDGFTAHREGEIMRVKMLEGSSAEQAQRYSDEQAVLLEGIFDPQLPPYPEFLMQENACDEKYHPIRTETQYGVFYTLFANDRLGYGVCSDDVIAYRSGFGLFYCPNKNMVVHVELFMKPTTPHRDVENIMASFTCEE